MIAYRSDSESIEPQVVWRALASRAEALTPAADHDDFTALLIDVGEVESAIADRLNPERDGLHPLAVNLAAASLAVARLFVLSWHSAERANMARAVDHARRAIGSIDPAALPAQAERRVSEGYAYYALHPEAHALAAEQFVAHTRPAEAVVIGIRTIGTSLAAVAAAAIEWSGIAVRTCSVRPRGHPFDRHLSLDDEFERTVRTHAPRAHFVVADEGPGLSGSSFAATARALVALGVAPERIVFLPSWDADGSTFNSDSARAQWTRHRKWVAPARDAGVGIQIILRGERGLEWSAGAWRAALPCPEPWPAVNPRHERVKLFLPAPPELVRFAGLGRYGAERQARAAALAAGGFGPQPAGLESGYLRLPFVDGTPCVGAHAPSIDAQVNFAGRYLAFLAREFHANRKPDLEDLHTMAAINLSEADPSLVMPPLSDFDAALADADATVLDGRMLRHELIATASGLAKVDALDHAADHFYPGVQDIAWDLAAAEAELGLDAAGSAALLHRYARESGDAHVGRRMPFYRLVYAAFQIGYAALSSASPGSIHDGERFRRRAAAFLERARALRAGALAAGRSSQ